MQRAGGGAALRVGGAGRRPHLLGVEMDEGVERCRLLGLGEQGLGIRQSGRLAPRIAAAASLIVKAVGSMASFGKGARRNDHSRALGVDGAWTLVPTPSGAERRFAQPSERNAAWTIAAASTSKCARSAARVSLRPKPSVPSVTQRRPGGRKARICSGTART